LTDALNPGIKNECYAVMEGSESKTEGGRKTWSMERERGHGLSAGSGIYRSNGVIGGYGGEGRYFLDLCRIRGVGTRT